MNVVKQHEGAHDKGLHLPSLETITVTGSMDV